MESPDAKFWEKVALHMVQDFSKFGEPFPLVRGAVQQAVDGGLHRTLDPATLCILIGRLAREMAPDPEDPEKRAAAWQRRYDATRARFAKEPVVLRVLERMAETGLLDAKDIAPDSGFGEDDVRKACEALKAFELQWSDEAPAETGTEAAR